MVDYTSLYQQAGNQYNIDPALLHAMALTESNESTLDPRTGRLLTSGAGAQGFMQFMPDTAKQYGVNVNDPRSSIFGAAHYMDDLLNQTGGNVGQALALYNGAGRSPRQAQVYANTIQGYYQGLKGRGAATDNTQQQTATAPSPAPTDQSDSDRKLIESMSPQAAKPAGPPTQQQQNDQQLIESMRSTGVPAAGQIDPYTHRPVQFMGAAPSSDVVTQSLGKPVSETQVPGPAFQAAINTATDPEQKRRIAADQLAQSTPGLTYQQALSRLRYGTDQRLVMVDNQGNPYYVEPRPVMNGPGNLFQVNPYGSQSIADQIRGSALTPANVVKAGGAAVPRAGQEAAVTGAGVLTGWNPAAVGGTQLGTDVARQAIANQLDPEARSKGPSDISLPMAGNALLAAGTSYVGGRLLPNMIRSATVAPVERQFPIVPGRAPWSGQEVPVAPAPTVPPGARVIAGPPGYGAYVEAPPEGAAGFEANPFGDAAEAAAPGRERGAYAPTPPREIAAIPTTPPRAPITPVVTQAQAEARADEILRYFAANGPRTPDTRQLISNPTLAQSTGNAGLATLERTVRNMPEGVNTFRAVDEAQNNARRDFVNRLVGTPEQLQNMINARSTATSALRDAAFAPGNTAMADAEPAVRELQDIIAGPQGKREGIVGPLRGLLASFYRNNDPEAGILETDPQRLYGVRQNITDSLGPMARSQWSDQQAASSLLRPVLNTLDDAIADAAPGYRQYMNAFRQQSGPIDAMSWLQRRNLTDVNGDTSLGRVDQAIKALQRERAMPGARDADSLTPDQVNQLNTLRDDLRRQANLRRGMPLGSNTMQNLAGSQTLNVLMSPISRLIGRGAGAVAGGLPGVVAEQGAENMLAGTANRGEQMVRRALIDRLLNTNGSGVRALQGGP